MKGKFFAGLVLLALFMVLAGSNASAGEITRFGIYSYCEENDTDDSLVCKMYYGDTFVPQGYTLQNAPIKIWLDRHVKTDIPEQNHSALLAVETVYLSDLKRLRVDTTGWNDYADVWYDGHAERVSMNLLETNEEEDYVILKLTSILAATYYGEGGKSYCYTNGPYDGTCMVHEGDYIYPDPEDVSFDKALFAIHLKKINGWDGAEVEIFIRGELNKTVYLDRTTAGPLDEYASFLIDYGNVMEQYTVHFEYTMQSRIGNYSVITLEISYPTIPNSIYCYANRTCVKAASVGKGNPAATPNNVYYDAKSFCVVGLDHDSLGHMRVKENGEGIISYWCMLRPGETVFPTQWPTSNPISFKVTGFDGKNRGDQITLFEIDGQAKRLEVTDEPQYITTSDGQRVGIRLAGASENVATLEIDSEAFTGNFCKTDEGCKGSEYRKCIQGICQPDGLCMHDTDCGGLQECYNGQCRDIPKENLIKTTWGWIVKLFK